MVAISFVLVLALVSSTVVAQPGTNGCTGLFSCFKRQPTPAPPKIPTESVHEWIPPSEETPTLTSDQDPVKIGLSYILQQLNIQPGQFTSRTSFTDRLGVTHLYGAPLYKGSLIGDLHAAAHIKNGQVFFYSATTVINDDHALTKRSPTISKSRAKLSSKKAVKAAVDRFKIPFYRDIPPVKGSYSTNDGDIPVWIFHLRDNPTTQWIEIKVNAITVNPENLQASPNGWTDGYKLAGNNVLVRIEGGTTFKTTTRGVFSGGFDPTLPPQTPRNLVAGVINAFYVANTAHDVFYEYGFTEKAGNFQQDNFGRGGIGGDPVIINVQSSKKKNHAGFNTPFDGHPGMLNLHIFTATEPNRDPALDNTVIVHELTHGLTARLTGGAQTKLCVSGIESEGLNEGYSDMMAMIFTAKPEDTRNTEKVIGEYVQGNPRGMRRYPYTTDMKVNPLKYQNAVGEKDPYHLGEIWASLLLEVYCNLVDEYGFSANLHDATQKEGNVIFIQLFVGTLMIQPCEPTFESAYDAMLAADYAYYGGIHEHLIRKGFFKRGLGSISQLDPTMDDAV
ncbi:hypothetical protein BSLG_010767 [Batrachochytrium salamandrivorans]|nr:hypothetical protein BSLG_010767 [Batrachochytrium salamandrivorans]